MSKLLNWLLLRFGVNPKSLPSSANHLLDGSLLRGIVSNYDIDIGWRLSEDREMVLYEVYCYPKGSSSLSTMSTPLITAVCDPRPLRGSLASIILKGLPGPENW